MYYSYNLVSKHFRTFLLDVGRRKMQYKKNYEKETLTNTGVEYTVFWLADLAVIYFEKTNLNKKEIKVEVKFEKMLNL